MVFNFTVRLNISETVAVPSLAVILTEIVPPPANVGTPKKVLRWELNVSHEGSAEPLASVAEYVKLSFASTSANVLAGTSNLNTASSCTV